MAEFYLQHTPRKRNFYLVLAADHVSPAPGLSPTVELSKNGQPFAAAQGTVLEIGNGWYTIDLATFDVNSIGGLKFHIEAGTADPTDFEDQVIHPQDVIPNEQFDTEHLQNVATKRCFVMVDVADHITGKTGLSPTVQISKADGGFANIAGTVAEVGYGWYEASLTAADVNTLGSLKFSITATGADPTDFEDTVVAVVSGKLGISYRTVPADAYGSIEEADDYFATRLNVQTWTDETDDNKRRALIEACRLLDTLNYQGDKTDANQKLEFPRGGDTEIPAFVKEASFEIAINLLDGRDIEYEAETLNAASAGGEVARVKQDTSFIHESIVHGIPSVRAWNLLKPFFRDGRTITLSRVN